ncbi:MAG: hypothetical protein OXF22_09180 [Anaerolineaceae bacterium]|nr:hypothetical protein [Anaerolineaceae bacterium]
MNGKWQRFALLAVIAVLAFGAAVVNAQEEAETCENIEFDEEVGFSSFLAAVDAWLCQQGIPIVDWWTVIGETLCGNEKIVDPSNWKCVASSASEADSSHISSDSAVLWLYVWRESRPVERKFLRISAETSVDIDEYGLTILVFLNDRRKNIDYCNDKAMFADEPAVQLGCSRLIDDVTLSNIETVRATIRNSLEKPKHLICKEHDSSSAEELVFTCNWR